MCIFLFCFKWSKRNVLYNHSHPKCSRPEMNCHKAKGLQLQVWPGQSPWDRGLIGIFQGVVRGPGMWAIFNSFPRAFAGSWILWLLAKWMWLENHHTYQSTPLSLWDAIVVFISCLYSSGNEVLCLVTSYLLVGN